METHCKACRTVKDLGSSSQRKGNKSMFWNWEVQISCKFRIQMPSFKTQSSEACAKANLELFSGFYVFPVIFA